MKCTFKVSIIGVGKVGVTTAYALYLDGIVTNLVLVAHHRETAAADPNMIWAKFVPYHEIGTKYFLPQIVEKIFLEKIKENVINNRGY